MAKLKIPIDHDNDFLILETGFSIFGRRVEFGLRLAVGKSGREQNRLSALDQVVDMSPDEYSEAVEDGEIEDSYG